MKERKECKAVRVEVVIIRRVIDIILDTLLVLISSKELRRIRKGKSA